MDPRIKIIDRCRLCSDAELLPCFSLSDLYVSDFVTKENIHSGVQCPIELVMCANRQCKLVQTRHTAPQDFLYTRHYWYTSGTTATMRNALMDVALNAQSRVELNPGDVVLDIGSNDGTLLRSYTKHRISRVGVEPASNLAEIGAQGITTLYQNFWGTGSAASDYQLSFPKAKVITALGMFYDLDDPNAFIRDVAAVLADDGIFIAQLMCLKNMMVIGDISNFCHEHLEYYSLLSLRHLFDKHGMEIFDLETNGVNGESYRIYARKRTNAPLPSTFYRFLQAGEKEVMMGLHSPDRLAQMFKEMMDNLRVCADTIRNTQCSKSVWVYGASTKGNTILQLLQGMGVQPSWFGGAADKSPEKWGKYTIGTGIEIKSEDDFRAADPNYALVLPYSFLQEFIERENTWRGKGGKFLVPIPNFRVV